jgi:PKD repeat protein
MIMRIKTINPSGRVHVILPAFCIVLIAILVLPAGVSAGDFTGGLPVTTVKTGTVTGDLWFDATPAPDWGSQNVVKTFTLPAAAFAEPGRIKWARLYISGYVGQMQNDYAFSITNKLDGNGDGTYEHVWPETGHAPFAFIGQGGCNDNSAFPGLGGTSCDPYKIINDHETRVTSDYFMWYNVTDMISSQTVNVNADTTGSFDGRIKIITLVVAYDDPASTTQTSYWVNEGHDALAYYTEEGYGYIDTGDTTFGTRGTGPVTSAILTIDHLASSGGKFGFPDAANVQDMGSTPYTITYTSPLTESEKIVNVQGPYSGLISWDVTSMIPTSGNTVTDDVTFGYARNTSASGLSAFFKLPLAFLVIKRPLPASSPVAGFAADTVSGTVPLTVTFTDQSTNTPTSWAWTFGDGGTSDQQNPSHQYTTAGTYTVTLTATNSAGSDDETKTNYIAVGESAVAPVAAFSGTPTTGTAPLPVTFTDASTNVPTSWAWTFGDSDTTNATMQNPVHTYVSAGTYTVTLTATNAGGSNTTTRTNYISATAAILPDLTITGMVNPVPAGAVFARETNPVTVTNVKNNGTIAVSNIVVALYASDVSTTVPVATTTIASLASGATTTASFVDPTLRNLQGGTVTYTAKVDPDNLIPEKFEGNNNKNSIVKNVLYNGYKGKGIYWDGGSNITTKSTYDLRGNVIYSTQPASAYKGVGWTSRTETWTAADLPVPSGATIEKVLLYFSYNWDQTPGGYPNLITTFNGNPLTLAIPYRDWSNFGAYSDYEYGLYPAADVTTWFVRDGDNTLLTTPGSGNLNALYPSTLVVIYSDASATRKQIFINEECDELGLSESSYSTSLAETIAYAPFSGMTIDPALVQTATLHSFAGSAGPNEGNLIFNGASVATSAWQGTASTASAQTFNVKSLLTATGNEAGIQGTTSGGMDALQQILVIEYSDAAPVAAFSGTPTSGTSPLTVTFTDASTNTPTSWAWTFGDGDSTNATVRNPVHTYAAAGNYTVTLIATNTGGSNTATQTDYIKVTSPLAVVTLPGQTNPPTDPDSDGLYEDLNGNGRKDGNDYQLYFRNSDWIAANEPIALFDFNSNARIDGNDYQLLFRDL